MSTPADQDASQATAAPTGRFHRWTTRWIVVCAAIGAGLLASGTTGWFLQKLLNPGAAVAESEEPEQQTALHDRQLPHDSEPDGLKHDEDDLDEHPADGVGHVEAVGQPHLEHHETNSGESPGGRPLVGMTFVGTLDDGVAVDADELLKERSDYRTPDALAPSNSELERAAALGESYMLESDAVRALQQFDWVLKYDDRAHDERFHYRCGVCAEMSSDPNRALREYAMALEASHDPTIIALCRLGQARVWRLLGNLDFATQLLSGTWLTNGREGHAPLVRSFNAYLLADALAAGGVALEVLPLTDDTGVVFPNWEFDLFDRRLLNSIRQENPQETPIKGGVRLLSEADVDGIPDQPVLEINLPRMGVVNLVEALCREARWKVAWTSAAKTAANGRSAEICQSGTSLPLCLDVLTAPLGVVWTRHDLDVRIEAVDEADAATVAAARQQAARRALEHAVRRYPDFMMAPEALVTLGNIALREGRGDEALALYQEVLEQHPTDPVRSPAWFNLAKLHLSRDYTDAALDAFWHVIDSGGPPDVASIAYLYVGRLLIDAEQPRRAVTPLIRATKWAPRSEDRAKSVLCLAAAYLLYGNPKGANDVLMDFRSDVQSQSNEAAFLSALARYRVAESPTRKFYEGQALLSAVDPVKPQDFFGRYGWYLCGTAYEELLLPEIAAGVYEQAFETLQRPPYHDELSYGLATSLAASGDAEAANQRFKYMLEHAQPDWQRRAAFQLCRLQLQSNLPQAAAHTAYELIPRCSDLEDRARALHLLGESYQRLGDHAAAAMCFAGSVPDHPPPTETVNP